MSNEQWDAGLRPHRRADRGAPHHAGLRQHAAHGRARGAPPRRAPRRGARRRAPRQPCQGARLDAEQRLKRGELEGAGRDRVAGARHRHRRRRSRRASSARRARSPPSCSGSAAPATPSAACRRAACSRSRATSWSNARRCSTACAAASSTRCTCRRSRSTCWRSRSSPRSPAANGTRTSSSRCAPRLALSRRWTRDDFDAVVRMLAEGFTTRRGRAARSSITTPSTTCCAAARRAADGADLGRHDPRQRRLPGAARAGGDHRRHRQRGLRGREHGRRRLPARQHLLSHPARRARRRARRGRAGRGADHSVLARRGAGPQRRAVVRRRRGCAPRSATRLRATAASAPATRMAALGDSASTTRRRARSSTTSRAAQAALGALPTQDGSSSSASSTNRAACSWSPFALWQPHQSRLGAGAAQALLPQLQFRAPGGRDRGRHRAVAFDQPQLSARRGRALPAFGDARSTCWCRRCSTRRCSPRAGAGTRPPRWRCRASPAARRSRRSCSG